MLEKRTVLVLGAGASRPYAFPVGERLFKDIVRGLAPSELLHRQLRACGCREQEVIGFRDELARSQRLSIDAFLQHRTEFIPIGKLAIAARLAPMEQEQLLLPTFEDFAPEDLQASRGRWYHYLFGLIAGSLNRFAENQVSVVTFNYERSFEQALYLYLKHNFHLMDEVAEQRRQELRITHVYGQLGGPRYSVPQVPAGQPYDPSVVAEWAKGIKLVHERGAQGEAFEEAQDQLQHASVVCFLGFGYDRDNLAGLRLSGLPTDTVRLYGTTHGLMGAESQRANRNVGREINFYDKDVLSFLRDVDTFT